MSNSKNVLPLFIAIAIVALSIGIFTQISGNKQAELPELAKTIILPAPKTIQDTPFIDHHGQPFGLEQMRGKWNILFFGFTNCPDICPTTMRTLSAVKKKVSEAGSWNNYQVIMVSVDPERDTTERLANYVPYFDPEFIGLSAELDSTTAFAKQLGILFVKRDGEPSADGEPLANKEPSATNKKPSADRAPAANKEPSSDKQTQNTNFYQVDHSASIILINPEGQWAGVITAPHKVDEISDDLIKLAQHSKQFAPQTSQDIAPRASDKSSAPLKKALTNETLDSSNESQSPAKPALTISNAWIRPAPPNAPSMAAYMELINHSNNDITLIDVQSPAFAHAMIHNTTVKDGIASMHHLDELVIPANSRISLRPLGMHMMLMRPSKTLEIGDEIDVILNGSNNQRYTAIVPVQEPSDNSQ